MTGLPHTRASTAANMTAVTTLLHRKLALAAGLLCVAAPVLSSCGFDYATDRPNVIADGGYDMNANGMRVLAARIVSSGSGKGVFVATLALNPTAEAATAAKNGPKLTGLSAAPDSSSSLTAGSFSPVAVTSTGAVNMADPSVGGIPVTGTFDPGASIPVVLQFSNGKSVTVQTPVVTQCHDYASVTPQATESHGGGKAGRRASASASASASDSASASASDSASAEPSSDASGSVDCAYPSLPPIGE